MHEFKLWLLLIIITLWFKELNARKAKQWRVVRNILPSTVLKLVNIILRYLLAMFLSLNRQSPIYSMIKNRKHACMCASCHRRIWHTFISWEWEKEWGNVSTLWMSEQMNEWMKSVPCTTGVVTRYSFIHSFVGCSFGRVA